MSCLCRVLDRCLATGVPITTVRTGVGTHFAGCYLMRCLRLCSNGSRVLIQINDEFGTWKASQAPDVCRWMLLLDGLRGLGVGRRTCWHWAHLDPNQNNTSSCMRTALHLIPHLCARSHQATWLYDAMLARSTGTRSPRESKASHPFSCTKLPTDRFGRTIRPRVSTFVCLNRFHPLPFSRFSHSIPHNHEFGKAHVLTVKGPARYVMPRHNCCKGFNLPMLTPVDRPLISASLVPICCLPHENHTSCVLKTGEPL